MSDRDSEQRHEEPTAHRREEARRRGSTPRSRDLSVALGLLASAACLHLGWGGSVTQALGSAMGAELSGVARTARCLDIQTVVQRAESMGFNLLLVVGPVGAALLLGTAASGLSQGGFTPRWQAVVPDSSRLDPRQGLSRIFKAQSALRGLLAVLKLGAMGWLLSVALTRAVSTSSTSAGMVSGFVMESWDRLRVEASLFALRSAAALTGLGVLDYGLQRWLHSRSLRMSRLEVIEETAELEGNADVKRRQRSLRKSMVKLAPGGERGDS